VAGLVALHVTAVVSDRIGHPCLWPPEAGLGLALTFWLGPWGAGLAATDRLLVHVLGGAGGAGLAPVLGDAAFTFAELLLAWWWYVRLGRGSVRLNDPRSATLFLLLVPGAAFGLGAFGRAWLGGAGDLGEAATGLWVTRALGVLALAPPLLLILTPWLNRSGLVAPGPGDPPEDAWPEGCSWGEAIEGTGLALGAGVLGAVLVGRHAVDPAGDWPWSGVLLLVTVWAGLRAGLRGSAPAAAAAAVLALAAAALGGGPGAQPLALQGHLLALCSTALLVGASTGWIRASEVRYRQAVGHMPVVLYSARLLRVAAHGVPPLARVTLASPACREVFGCEPEDLLGDFGRWLDRVHAEDREVVLAALAQLCRQNQPVTCEYRLRCPPAPAAPDLAAPAERWVRDTLAPRHADDGRLLGWEGVLEDTTQRRALAAGLRRTSTMLHALVANLPAGVVFVRGPGGHPILVNARARHLLGRWEDLGADLTHFPAVYRLHRPDGTPYPWQELPVTAALHGGRRAVRDDIVVHAADGRRIPLVSWAAPARLDGEMGPNGAAVWVFEDRADLQQAEAARLESESRLRTLVETMAEGLIIQDEGGAVREWNPAACAILGVPADRMAGRPALAPAGGCLREDGSACPHHEQPDQVCLRTRAPVRNAVLGIPAAAPAGLRWILVNAMPLLRPGTEGGTSTCQVVTTFADVTAYRQALAVVRASEEKYRGLVEALPLAVVQVDRAGRITYHNPAARQLLGEGNAGAEPWHAAVRPEDRPAAVGLQDQALAGESARAEFRYRGGDGTGRSAYGLGTPLRHDGAVVGATLLIVDLTLQRRLEQELGRVQRLELMARLAGGIVHDFNNLLGAALGLACQAQDALPPGHAAAADLAGVQDALEQAGRLAGQLLTFSKQWRVELRPVPLDAAVGRALALLRGSLPSNVVVESALGCGPAAVRADEGQLQQVLMNLCLNARDAMPVGGRLTISTALASPPGGAGAGGPEPTVRNGRPAGPWVCLRVDDTGQGMSAAVAARIFEPFFTTKERGTGLGLAVVRQLVESFSGRIDVRSEPGRGTRFDVWLPVCALERREDKLTD
jgi:PAS domain S-box-containing protein